MMTIIFMMTSINMLFLFLNHPMSMGLILIIQTLMVSMLTGVMMKTFWMSYVLTITMLSGMLVLFIYMSSVASNEKFKNKISLWMMCALATVVSTLSLFLFSKMIIKNNYSGMEMNINKISELFFLNKMFNSKNSIIIIMMVMYLFMTMVVSTHLVNITEGPMRLKV